MPSYTFDVEHATRWGLNEAVFLHNLIHWLRVNKAERRNVLAGTDGVTRVWSYNTLDAYVALFPFWTLNQVRGAISSLEKQGVVVSDYLHKDRSNRTKWYALTDESLLGMPDQAGKEESISASLPSVKNHKSTRASHQKACGKPQNHVGKSTSGAVENHNSIIGSDTKTTDVQTTNINPTRTLNVGEGNINLTTQAGEGTNSRDSDDMTFSVVEAVVEKLKDPQSRRRFRQLRLLCRDNNRLGLWQEALRSTERRMKIAEVAKPGAYFCTALVRLLEDSGVNVPAGTAAERGEVNGAIAASLGATLTGDYAAS